MEDAMAIQREQLERLNDFLGPMNQPSTAPKPSSITFSNPAAEQFFVDGTKIPDGILFHVLSDITLMKCTLYSEFRCWSLLRGIDSNFWRS